MVWGPVVDDYKIGTPGLLKQVQMMRCEDSSVLFHIWAVTTLTLDSYVPSMLHNTVTRRDERAVLIGLYARIQLE